MGHFFRPRATNKKAGSRARFRAERAWRARQSNPSPLLQIRGQLCCRVPVQQPECALHPGDSGCRHLHRTRAEQRHFRRGRLIAAAHHKPDLTRPVDHRQRETDSLRWRFRCCSYRDHGAPFVRGGMFGKDRCHVAVWSHAEQADVENNVAKLSRVRLSCLIKVENAIAGRHLVYSIRIQPERLGKQVESLLSVPVWMISRHEPLVPPPKLDTRPVDRRVRSFATKPFIGSRGDPTAGECDLWDPEIPLDLGEAGHEAGGQSLRHLISSGMEQDFGTCRAHANS
jgi:hypothetical protein